MANGFGDDIWDGLSALSTPQDDSWDQTGWGDPSAGGGLWSSLKSGWSDLQSALPGLQGALKDAGSAFGGSSTGQQQQAQRAPQAPGMGGAGAPQLNRGQAGGLSDLLQMLQQRRQQLAGYGLQQGPFQPRGPGLLGM